MQTGKFCDAYELLDEVAAEMGLSGGARGELDSYEAVWNAAHPEMPYERVSFTSWFVRTYGDEGNGTLACISPAENRTELAEGYGAELVPWAGDDGSHAYRFGYPDGPWLAEPLAALVSYRRLKCDGLPARPGFGGH